MQLTLSECVPCLECFHEGLLRCQRPEVPPGHAQAISAEEVLIDGLQLRVQLDGSAVVEEEGGLGQIDEGKERIPNDGIDRDSQNEEAPQSEADTARSEEEAEGEQVGGDVGHEQESIGQLIEPMTRRLH